MRIVGRLILGALVFGLISAGLSVSAASGFANAAFETQWKTGEASTPNFWGPVANATNGMSEQYAGSSNAGQDGYRLVQYFDKGRMELTNPTTGTVTSGLLATEMVTGKMQIGDTAFQPKAQPSIPIAGDPDNTGPTYATLATKANTLLAMTANQVGKGVSVTLSASGDPTSGGAQGDASTTLSAFDATTGHNVAKTFADYREKVGLTNVGYAIAEPFFATVKVGGQPHSVLIQVFERRVLTYTASNPAAFQVEMGNIGQHYHQWRYDAQAAGATAASPAPVVPAPSTSPAATTPAVSGTDNYQLTATTSPAKPTTDTIVTVTATLTTNGKGVAGAVMDTTWHLNGANVSCSFGPSGPDGVMSCQRIINKAIPGRTATIEVFVSYKDQQFMTTTTFVPRVPVA